ncbi:MAG: serine/threonine-protein kinase [Algisphaera sp.]
MSFDPNIPAPSLPHADVVTPEHPLRIEMTDARFDRYWKSGSLKYDQFKPLAEGGTAMLQTCRDINLNRLVVYKALHDHLATDETEVARFLREARVTANIAHPGTAPIYEIGRDKMGNIYFTMKLIEGRDLRSIFAALAAEEPSTQAAYPMPRRIEILLSAARTLAYAHGSGVVHRDIKPANILIDAFGEITVLDWGLAKVHGEPAPPGMEKIIGTPGLALELTQPGRQFGTPLYMSPEQAQGGTTDERTDVYGLGAILFEMLTGKPLIFGQDLDKVVQQILERPTPRPSDIAPQANIPVDLEALCLRCLSRDPADRFPNLPTLIAELEAIQSSLVA